ncbi:phosphoribosylanthranilate isomerase [Marinobacterium mangrovicola]|uniref:N-(5'-phosphoribosyl)anthranilate isomerase n=1 Tax=Marinobacterium mangrovicola TaxID=1476959 RepID=A0A4R1GLI8_9GAMM|nr:phosphoribosylanthranilate isomerase [Marinobacterium mangrovicola]TCK09437.1 phosphoribosylanthranilate isomerase [Marinobacterium mangrovicola]
MPTRVKICGITRVEDALVAVVAGADALGFVFYASSPRAVVPEQARAIIAQLPPFVTTTALFVNPEPDLVREAVAVTGVDLLQFHGDEDPDFCERFGRPWIKALRMKPGMDLVSECERYASGRGILLDAYRPGVPGGTGETFDWELIPADIAPKITLAGGLDVENVANAIAAVRPYAVDVSGGVEASKGIKDPALVRNFVAAVRSADGGR